jgi:hypothetical protein
MDVYTQAESRVRAAFRGLRPLDGVIDRAKKEAAEEEERERLASRMRNAEKMAALAGRGTAMDEPTGGGGEPSDWAQKPRRSQPVAWGPGGPRPRETVSHGERTIKFESSIHLFKGGRPFGRRYPHEVDQNRLRVQMGAGERRANIKRELREARDTKNADDTNAIADLEDACDDANDPNAGERKLRLGRIAREDQWAAKGELCRRGQVATWRWTPGYYVLCDGMLHEFAGDSLSSPIVNAWPVLGATCVRSAPSSQAHPHVLELRINRFYVDAGTEILARLQLSAPSLEERNTWIRALERDSLKVSKAFKYAGAHAVEEIDDAPRSRRGASSARKSPRPTSARRGLLGLGRRPAKSPGRGGKGKKAGRSPGRSPRRGQSPGRGKAPPERRVTQFV